jgi:hypothetical protein
MRVRDIAAAVRRWEQRTRPVDAESAAAAARRWAELPEAARTAAPLGGRRSTGCEGTHGVFPACNFACKPCYHSVDANRVRTDGAHTVVHVRAQMAHLRQRRGPAAYAQLIGGEVSMLEPEDHARALETMRAHGRYPMSMSHGDFDEGYLRAVALRPDGTRRFAHLAFAAHIDTTMAGRRGAPKPRSEAELDPFRAGFVGMFDRLRAEYGITAYLAHTMTVTPENVDEIPAVIRSCRRQGWRMFSFQPAAYVGNPARWRDGYRSIGDDEVWSRVEAGVGRSLPYRVLQFGDLRCNRVSWGAFVGDRYVPVLEEDDPKDLAARDAYLRHLPGNYLAEACGAVKAARIVRLLLRRPGLAAVAVRWAGRFVGRAGGPWALRRGIRPVTFVMHRFIDAAVVGPAWEQLQRGTRAEDPEIRAAQERLQACVYTMAHPDADLLVPACVQHAVLDPEENRSLAVRLPLPVRRSDGAGRQSSAPISSSTGGRASGVDGGG